jgi:chromosome segregation ATPase
LIVLFLIGYRLNELTILNERFKIQLSEKDRTISTLQRTVSTLESRLGELPREAPVDRAQEELDAMHDALRRIAQEVITDADQVYDDGPAVLPEVPTSSLRSSSPLRSVTRTGGGRKSASPSRSRSRSPQRGGPSFADSTFGAVQAALSKRQLQVTDLRAKLAASREQGIATRKQLDDITNQLRQLEQTLLSTREERDVA